MREGFEKGKTKISLPALSRLLLSVAGSSRSNEMKRENISCYNLSYRINPAMRFYLNTVNQWDIDEQ